jgi:hypothetical protein
MALCGAALPVALALAFSAGHAVPNDRPDTSGTVSCTGGTCTCTAADFNTCLAVSDQFCGHNTMHCTQPPGGRATCTCTAKSSIRVPPQRLNAVRRPTTAAPARRAP